MTRIATPARVGAICADSYPFSIAGTPEEAEAICHEGIEAMYGYLGVITAARVQYILDAGMAFMPVALAGRYDGMSMVQQLKTLDVPPGVTVCMDLEGLEAYHADPVGLAHLIDTGLQTIKDGGWIPGLYVGSPQPFTSEELWKLKATRYWRGQGRIADRYGKLAEPTNCGWCVTQVFPSVMRGGVLVDIDVIGQDYLRRTPTWMVAQK